jgi:hypothetical protein
MRKKLDNMSEKCIFIGYSEQSKAYRLYNPVTKKFLVSRMSNSLRINHGVSKKMRHWIVKIHCSKLMIKQKVQNNKHIHQDCQDYRYKDNKNTLEMVLLPAVNHPLQQKINEQEA